MHLNGRSPGVALDRRLNWRLPSFARSLFHLSIVAPMLAVSVCRAETTASQYDANWPFDFRTAFSYESDGHPISEVIWIGRSFDDALPSADQFVLRVYSDLDGHPAEVLNLQEFPFTNEPEPQPGQSYRYTATLENPLDLPAFTTVWIEIQAQSDGLPQWGIDQILSPPVSAFRQIKGSLDGPREWTPYGESDVPARGAGSNAGLAKETPTTQDPRVSQCMLFSNHDKTEFHLEFSLANSGVVDVHVYDAGGREVANLFRASVESGITRIDVSGPLARLKSSSVYFLSVQLDGTVSLLKQKLVLVK